jgi:hypothetical protein
MRHDPRVSYQGQSCRKNNCMRVKPSFARQTQDGKNGVLGLLLSLALGQMIWAGTSVSAPSQTFILHPASAPALRIDFNYNYQNALPRFQKEPVLPGMEVARGLIPTVPPTPLLRNINDNELYLNTDHTRDLVNGKLATYRSTYRGHVIFTNLSVSSIREGLEIPYTLDLVTYEHWCWMVERPLPLPTQFRRQHTSTKQQHPASGGFWGLLSP